MNAPNLLFVYGSLKRGEVNFPVMIGAGAQFFSTGVTQRTWRLEQGPQWRRLLDQPAPGGERVAGELFVVGQEAGWQLLDAFEGHPHGYRRRLEDVVDETQQVHAAWIYFYVGE